jgi:CHAT domain-containing protein/CHASE3 domain sensor protein
MNTLKHISRKFYPVFIIAIAILLGIVVPSYAGLTHREQARIYYNQPGGYKKALEEYFKSIELKEENNTQTFKNSAYYWGYLTAAERLNQPKDAVDILLKATSIWPEDVQIYKLLASTYRKLNDQANAEKYQAIALRLQNVDLDIFNKNADQLHKSNEYHYKLAQRYESAGNFAKALEEYQKAVTSGEEARRIYEEARRMKGTGREYSGGYWCNSAYMKGRYVAMDKLFEREKGLSILEQAFELFPDVSDLHYLIGHDYMDYLKDYERAEEHLRKALEIAQTKSDMVCKYVFDENPIRGRKVVENNRISETRELHRVEDIAKCAISLAKCYIDEVEDRVPQKMQDNLDKAHSILTEALAMSDKLPHGNRSDSQINIFRILIIKSLARIAGDFPEYKGHNKELALQYALEMYNLDPIKNAAGVLGIQYLNLGQYDNAIKYLEEHRAKKCLWWDSPDPFVTYLKLSQAYQQKNQMEKASRIVDESFKWMKQWLNSARTDELKVAAPGQKWRQLFDYAIGLNLKMGESVKAFKIVEMAKGRATLDLLAASDNRVKEKTLGDMEKEKALLLAKIDEIQQKVRAEKNAENGVQLASLQRSLTLVADKTKGLREDINNCQSEIRSVKNMDVLSLQQVQDMLGAANATLIEYWSTNYVAVVSGDSFVIQALDRPLSPNKVEEFREAIMAQSAVPRGLEIAADRKVAAKNANKMLPLARELYDTLISPIEDYIETELVFIAPDGALNLLPFQALHDGQKYLIEKYSVDYIPSASVLKKCMAKRKKLGGKALVLGNPNLQEAKYKLVHAEEEAQVIAGMFPGAKVLLGNDANEKSVQLLGADFDVLHFACHGTVNLDNPMLSCLRLAPDKDNDGYLHAGEMFNLHLNAGLVTLSACESGLGKITSGNEVLGLTRAMMFAGTPSVVASLWKVDDAATARLMADFYQGLKSKNKVDALRDAQVRMVREGKTPFYWAAFCLYGDYM